MGYYDNTYRINVEPMRVLWSLSITFALLAIYVLPMHAQDGRFHIVGKLQLPTGTTSCERCSIELQDRYGQSQTITSGILDGFSFANLTEGVYFLQVRSNDFEDTRQVVTVSNEPTRVSIDLQLKGRDRVRGPLAGQVLDQSALLESYPPKVIELYEQAVKRMRKDDTQEAILLFEDAIRIAPSFYAAHNGLGNSYQSMRRLDDAEKEYRAAALINSSSPDPLIQLADVYMLRNEWESAIKASVEAIQRDPQSAPAFFNLGVSLYCAGGMEMAENALRKALEFDPKKDQARLLLINVHLKLGQQDNALEEINRYLSASPRGGERSQVSALRSRLRDRNRSKEGLEILFPLRLGPTVRSTACRN